MFKKVLVANRGEIALRIIRACKEMDIATVAIYSEVDAECLHVKFADEAYCIGPAAPLQSYLNIPAIISVAEVTGAEAIHPGYGFLAENAYFAEVCAANQIVFIGPPVGAIEKMGNKSQARQTMQKAKIPIVPGSNGITDSDEKILRFSGHIGYPIIIKAAAGGGGRGMRIAQNKKELLPLVETARSEAQAAFGNSDVYLEKYIQEPHHIEFQILADAKGNVIHLGERDCSIQRRHQKLIEESPSPMMTEKLRRKMGDTAVKAAKSVGYVGAGTIEFLVEKNMDFYFMEMNTRIQVEHGVTEMVTGLDLIKAQITIAAGEKLPITQGRVELNGHCIEFRINAEDHERGFIPCAGKMELFLPPGGPGVRVDTHIYPGYTIPPNYDSLMAKLLVWARTRDEAIARGQRALDEFVVDGVSTTIPFHQRVLSNAFFRKGDVYTNFVARHMNLDVK